MLCNLISTPLAEREKPNFIDLAHTGMLKSHQTPQLRECRVKDTTVGLRSVTKAPEGRGWKVGAKSSPFPRGCLVFQPGLLPAERGDFFFLFIFKNNFFLFLYYPRLGNFSLFLKGRLSLIFNECSVYGKCKKSNLVQIWRVTGLGEISSQVFKLPLITSRAIDMEGMLT